MKLKVLMSREIWKLLRSSRRYKKAIDLYSKRIWLQSKAAWLWFYWTLVRCFWNIVYWPVTYPRNNTFRMVGVHWRFEVREIRNINQLWSETATSKSHPVTLILHSSLFILPISSKFASGFTIHRHTRDHLQWRISQLTCMCLGCGRNP